MRENLHSYRTKPVTLILPAVVFTIVIIIVIVGGGGGGGGKKGDVTTCLLCTGDSFVPHIGILKRLVLVIRC